MHSTHHSLYEQHLHGGGSCGVSSIQAVVFYYHCDLRQETLEDLMSKSATLLFLTFDNIWIDKHRWPNTLFQSIRRKRGRKKNFVLHHLWLVLRCTKKSFNNNNKNFLSVIFVVWSLIKKIKKNTNDSTLGQHSIQKALLHNLQVKRQLLHLAKYQGKTLMFSDL